MHDHPFGRSGSAEFRVTGGHDGVDFLCSPLVGVMRSDKEERIDGWLCRQKARF